MIKNQQPLNRRKFIKQSAILGAGALVLPQFLTAKSRNKTRITIVHTNDFHSHIDPFPDSHPRWPGQGGASKIKTLINAAKEENENILILDSGDMFQGTPYFNLFGGVAELEWMNHAGYMAGTMGNHEFDNGVDKLAEVLKHADFPILNCNYEIENPALKAIIKPYIIKIIGGKKIGITAVGINLVGLIGENNRKGINYTDPIKPLQNVVNTLRKKEKCDMVIVLSHLGFKYDDDKIDDHKLAAKTTGIDLILGGHTHTFLDKPVIVKNAKGRSVVINQAGWAGLKLGKLVWEI